MGKSIRGSKSPGYDWWTRRPGSTHHGQENRRENQRFWKRYVHRVERQRAKVELRVDS